MVMTALCTKLSAGEHRCQAPWLAIVLQHFCCPSHVHMNRTQCLAKPCKSMFIKLSPCCQSHEVYLFPVAYFFLHSEICRGPILPEHQPRLERLKSVHTAVPQSHSSRCWGLDLYHPHEDHARGNSEFWALGL